MEIGKRYEKAKCTKLEKHDRFLQRSRYETHTNTMKSMYGCILLAFIAVSGQTEDIKYEPYSEQLVKKAETGDAASQLRLGDLYERGKGVNINLAEAAKWYSKSAEQGNAKAKFFLGRMYFSGKGVKKDLEKASNLWEKGAEQGDMWCQYSLGTLFQEKAGVAASVGQQQIFLPSPQSQQNIDKAEKWFSKSAEQGFQPAINALTTIANSKSKKPKPGRHEKYEYVIKGGNAVIIRCESNEESLSLPQTINNYQVVRIENGAFEDKTSLKKILIPEGVKLIGPRAFKGCSRLKEIKLPNSLEEIGSESFADCVDLKEVLLGTNLVRVDYEAFRQCENISELRIPKTLKEIGEGAFSGCASLAIIKLPDELDKIGKLAFRDCVKLDQINIPEKVQIIEDGSFEGCLSLRQVKFHRNSKIKQIGKYAFTCSGLVEIELPSDVEEIEESAFSSMPNLEKVTMGKRVVKIQDRAFYLCKRLKTVLLCSTLKYLGEGVFEECYDLGSISISAPSIKISTFNLCRKLTNVVISDAKVIEYNAFRFCEKLSDITIPDSVESIEGGAFTDCSGLKNIVIGNGIASIKTGSFSGYTNLSTITIGSGVKVIEDQAFKRGYSHEEKLLKVFFRGDRPSLNNLHPNKNILFYYTKGANGWAGSDARFVKENNVSSSTQSP